MVAGCCANASHHPSINELREALFFQVSALALVFASVSINLSVHTARSFSFFFVDPFLLFSLGDAFGISAALLYYTVNRKIQGVDPHEDELDGDAISTGQDHVCIEQLSNRLVQAPATWLEIISTLSETLRFTYLETLGKWPIADLAFGINFPLKRQGILRVCDVFGGEDSVQVPNQDIIPELGYLMKLLTLCWYFSKKSFPMFLKDMAIPNKMFSYINISPG